VQVEVTTSIDIDAPRPTVAAYAADPEDLARLKAILEGP
jgi:hypothetical protein